MVVALVLGFSSCYNEFDDPAPAKVWTKADFAGCKFISIKEFKDLFYKGLGIDASSSAKYNDASTLGKYVEITDDYVISGKVISSDQAGNVYKSVYIYDEESQSGIELKLMVSNYVFYHLGQTLYVKTKGLCIGSYRYMLSLGALPTATDISNGYANRNLDATYFANQHVFAGKLGQLTDKDILTVNASNYKTALTDDALGRLVRFEGLQYKSGSFDSDRYPQYLETTYVNGSNTATYVNKYFDDEHLTPTYAYSYGGNHYYGSAWFGYADAGSTQTASGNYIVRSSGYANFALQPLPVAGTTGNITAIYTKYSSKSGGFIKYQLLLNSLDDVEGFKTAQ
jgi:hypothetical protein